MFDTVIELEHFELAFDIDGEIFERRIPMFVAAGVSTCKNKATQHTILMCSIPVACTFHTLACRIGYTKINKQMVNQQMAKGSRLE